MQFKPCDCENPRYQRLTRKWWMRLLPGTVSFRCASCKSRMLLRGEGTRGSVAQILLVVAGVLLTGVLVAYAIDYFDDVQEKTWKRGVDQG